MVFKHLLRNLQSVITILRLVVARDIKSIRHFRVKRLRIGGPAKPKITIPQGSELESPIPDSKSRLVRLTKTEARQYCQKINKTLLTFEQFANYAVSRGAKGLVDKEPEGELFNSTFRTERGTYIFDAKGYI